MFWSYYPIKSTPYHKAKSSEIRYVLKSCSYKVDSDIKAFVELNLLSQ